MKCQMIPSGGAYRIVTPYNSGFVGELKDSVPATDRGYDPNTRCWTVSAAYGKSVSVMINKWFGQQIIPDQIAVSPLLGVIELLYLGQSKDRGNGIRTAYGWVQDPGQLIGGWNAIFPEKVLKSYFDPSYTEQKEKPTSEKTYYEMLSIKQNATADEIRSGYRRMVRQWHPDVCKDPDANKIFIEIKNAYNILSDPKTKARYDVGLKIAATTKVEKPKSAWEIMNDALPYRAPLKCGNLLCEYTILGIKKTVTKILQWEDIYDATGKVLISSWVMGDSEPTLEWR